MKHMWIKLNYIPVLNMHLITQDLYFKENQFEERISSFLG